MYPLKINIFTLNASISTNNISMFMLAIKVYFKTKFGLIHATFLSLGSTKSVFFSLRHPVLTMIIYMEFISFQGPQCQHLEFFKCPNCQPLSFLISFLKTSVQD